jgi:hypothetical protein
MTEVVRSPSGKVCTCGAMAPSILHVSVRYCTREESRSWLSATYSTSDDETSTTFYEVLPSPMRVDILKSNPSLLIGISGVWNGFFMTASEYASYAFCSTASADVSAREVRSTNFVPVIMAFQHQSRVKSERKYIGQMRGILHAPVAVSRIVILRDSPSITCAPELLPMGDSRLVIAWIPWRVPARTRYSFEVS